MLNALSATKKVTTLGSTLTEKQKTSVGLNNFHDNNLG